MRTLVLFNYDWDCIGFGRHTGFAIDSAGFDLFSFPSNARLAGFDLNRWVDRLAKQAKRRGWQAVVSNHEQFGALAAALLAERMGWPGTPVEAVLACQHKLHARQVLQDVCPAANVAFAPLPARYGDPAPASLPSELCYPVFIKPVKAAFSVLARVVANRDDLHAMTRFGRWELWVIRHLVEPFERIARARLPHAGTAHRLLIEAPVHARQYNLDGYVFNGELRPLGIVESVMYPGTQAFARFVYPCAIEEDGRRQAIETAGRFLAAVGFDHGLFNMEFFYDAASGKLSVIEFNPRMAAQFSDLYLRVDGIDLHRVALELAHGRDPAVLPRAEPTAGIAASFVYRAFAPDGVPDMPDQKRQAAFHAAFPDGLLFRFPKPRGSMTRDFKWLGSYRYGIVHLGGRNATDLLQHCREASTVLGWPTPCEHPDSSRSAPAPMAILPPAAPNSCAA